MEVRGNLMTPRGMVVTVGTSPEPLIKTINEHKPESVLFIISGDSEKTVEESVLPKIRLKKPSYCRLTDEQRLDSCYKEINERIVNWFREFNLKPEQVFIDYTGGTKAMSAALTLTAVDNSIERFTYVGGNKRDDNNRGIVKTGHERIESTRNPHRARARQEIEQANLLLKNFYAGPAARVLKEAQSICDDEHKSSLCAYVKLTEALDYADRFRFGDAAKAFDKCRRELQLPQVFDQEVYKSMNSHSERWQGIKDETLDKKVVLLELLANAERRAKQERYDDAVGRLYRAVELNGQIGAESLGVKSGKLDLECSFHSTEEREAVKRELKLGKPGEDGKYKLGIQKLYRLLELEKVNGYGDIYSQLEAHLTVRNQSLLAHGLQPVSKDTFDKFWIDTLKALGIKKDTELPRWPEIQLKQP